MIHFECDYTEGAHPEILKRLSETNFEQTTGYGMDEHCARAGELIKKACGAPDADVHFLLGGTQANTTIIASVLRPYQGVISCDTGHINGHETGSVEATGHKILTAPDDDGRLTPEGIEEIVLRHGDDEHLVKPSMVYISFATESGTLYSKAQLLEISNMCKKYGLPLFVDGARMGYGLAAEGNDVTLHDIAELSDIFYIGGTKCGAMFGEAVVITNDALKKDFRYMIKRHGGMLAKGRMLGIQFETLFEEAGGEFDESLSVELAGKLRYMAIAEHAINQAMRIRDAFKKAGAELWGNSPTNQQFVVLTEEQMAKFGEKYSLQIWTGAGEGKHVCRFCTSWATKTENVDMLIADIMKICGA